MVWMAVMMTRVSYGIRFVTFFGPCHGLIILFDSRANRQLSIYIENVEAVGGISNKRGSTESQKTHEEFYFMASQKFSLTHEFLWHCLNLRACTLFFFLRPG